MKHVAVGVGLAIAVCSIYWRVYDFDFVNYDDDVYLLQNDRIQDGLSWDNIRWAFTTPYHSNWHPVTWLSYFLDYEIFGLRPGAFHLTNVAFHGVNAILLYAALVALSGVALPSAIAALLFAIHPMHVESVAWISERKDVLSMFFFLLTLLAYAIYARKPRPLPYILMLLAYTAGLMAKPMLVTVPILFLLLDAWPLGRFNRRAVPSLLAEKIPLALFAAGSAAITYLVQQSSGAMRTTGMVPLFSRIENALISYTAYLGDLVLPAGLAPFYPLSHDGPSLGALPLSLAALAIITLVVLRYAKKRPYLLVGWLWYLVALIPVIGLVQVGEQSRADRYLYIPALGVYIAVAWLLARGLDRGRGRGRGRSRRPRQIGIAGLVVVSLVLMFRSSDQVMHWRDSESLFRHTAQVTRNNHVAHNNLGVALRQRDLVAAEAEFRRALAIKPDYHDAHINLGGVYLQTDRAQLALGEYLEAARLAPEDPTAYFNLGITLQRLGRKEEAAGAFGKAHEFAPNDSAIELRFANALREIGDHLNAQSRYRALIERSPTNPEARCNLAVSLIATGKMEEAKQHLTTVVEHNPNHVEGWYNLGVVAAADGQLQEAAAAFEHVLDLAPGHTRAQANLSVLLSQ